ncbi:MAG TPA: helix-turn-helix domain-containing protein [Acidimicrobiales bacterium]|jgi:AraC-like DNA-binding protein
MPEPVVESVEGTPAPPLRSIIGGYLGYRIEDAPTIHRGLPSRYVTFIISLADQVDTVRMPDPRQPPAKFQAFVAGLHATPALIRQAGIESGISISLTPLGSRALLGMPAGELASTVVDLEEVFGSTGSGLADQLASAPGWHERFALLDGQLIDRLRDVAGPPPEVGYAWQRLVASHGAVAVAALADEVGYSRRHLNDLFARELGLAPKAAARVLRFERSRRLIEAAKGQGLAGVAAAAGYYDQAHMTRDWREIAGCPPTTWIAEELPSVQDAPVALGAD